MPNLNQNTSDIHNICHNTLNCHLFQKTTKKHPTVFPWWLTSEFQMTEGHQVGWGFEKLGVVEGVLAHVWGGTAGSGRSLPTQTALWVLAAGFSAPGKWKLITFIRNVWAYIGNKSNILWRKVFWKEFYLKLKFHILSFLLNIYGNNIYIYI